MLFRSSRYGVAPYTGQNTVLWNDLERGYIHSGTRAGTDERFARPSLSRYIPVDDNGNLKPPSQLMINGYNQNSIQKSYAVGDQGPVEAAWRKSSEFPFALQIALALGRPAEWFANLFDTSRYIYNTDLDQYLLTDTGFRITASTLSIPDNGVTGNEIVLTAGYGNFLRDYLIYQGVPDPSELMRNIISKVQVQLSYRVGGFTDKNILSVLAEQSSPTGASNSVILPNENNAVHLTKGTPEKRIVYSAVIVEKTATGFRISGYDTSQPYFVVIPSQVNSNAYTISVLGQNATVYKDYQLRRVSIPYGYELPNMQSVVDFFVS